MTGETFTTDTGQVIHNVHLAASCKGDWCVIHKPMPGPWSAWKTHWRPDGDLDLMVGMYRGFERFCPHGVGHPAAEEYQWQPNVVHGCDGCDCAPGKEELMNLRR